VLGEDDAGRVLRLLAEEHVRLVDPGELLGRNLGATALSAVVVEEADAKIRL
jgi:hypothetical protein